MGCFGDREKGAVAHEAKWDYINLSDFRSSSCLTVFSYIWLWGIVIVTLAVYGADTFTAINLLAFDRWSSQVDPAIKFEISKWIFSGCIILSFILAGYDWFRAIRIIKRGGIAESYLNELAVILQSIRMGKGQGWRRFLVFTELTKSKSGVDYIALFVYFQFQGALRIIFAEGPRMVINAVTLWSVMQAQLMPKGEHAEPDKGRNSFDQFWFNVEVLYNENKTQAVILSSMLFTLVIWVILALCLIIACILYILFLWHYIPSSDGRLSAYCRRKIDSRVERIVSKKMRKALDKEEAKRVRDEQRAIKRGKQPTELNRKPTLPAFMEDDGNSQFSLSRQDSFATLPPYASRPGTSSSHQRQDTNSSIGSDVRPMPPTRSLTQSTTMTYGSNAPLLSQAGNMGYGNPNRTASPAPVLPSSDSNDSFAPAPMARAMTSNSSIGPQRPYSPITQGRGSPAPSGMSGPYGPPSRSNTGFSNLSRGQTPGISPLSTSPPSSFDYRSQARTPGPAYKMSPVDPSPLSQSYNANQSTDDYDPFRSATPVQQPQRNYTPGPQNGGYVAFNPVTAGQRRDVSAPLPGHPMEAVTMPQRSFTAPPPQDMAYPNGGHRSESARPQERDW
ncbi:hypothetical protein M501DRAFT_937244 [Patellaria atrata CBS 101060]|uniref:Vacuolar membrane protein n=1 Tax=Patellaria atrata CBS 101060 TaxID=1346257 RepID=A0A9P4S980_9PEZI|nr:hypothetical protein M501DRAFT_937244 [Patellaria atrata CBS 101060]